MIRNIVVPGLASAAVFAANAEVGSEAAAPKSIVPSKYAGKYKNGGSDALAQFINDQCKDKDGNFEYAYFFDLCRKNGVKEEQVAKYEGLVADKANNPGIEGRARMTLRNMLAAIVRKEGKVADRDGDFTEMVLAKPATSGAAAKAQENAAAKGEPEAETTETVDAETAPVEADDEETE